MQSCSGVGSRVGLAGDLNVHWAPCLLLCCNLMPSMVSPGWLFRPRVARTLQAFMRSTALTTS